MKGETVIVILGATLILVMLGVRGVAPVGLGSFAHDIQVENLGEVEDAPPIVTLAELEQIRRSMSYRKVVEVIADPGIAIAPSTALEGADGDAGTSRHLWQNSDASNMKATFRDDRLLKKSQVFLK